MCLMESGAADKVVRRFLKIFGEKRAGWALLWSTYILSIPIFFDTMFMLMVPLAKALRLRTGKDYMLYVLCVCCGGVITHSLTIPHPGPLAMVDSLKIDIGVSLAAGLIGGLLAQTPDDPLLAAARGTLWHGMAADALARAHGQTSVMMTQLLDFLGPVLRGL
jgi:H+/gluconate symporter-like permease